MGLLDILLNLACLLLWLHWRTLGFSVLPIPGKSLLMTLQRPQSKPRRHRFLIMLGSLLILRAIFYWQVSPAALWTPVWSLGALSISFRSDFLGYTLLYSLLSFARIAGIFYLWLLLLSLVNRSVSDNDPSQRLVRLHLGRVETWPATAKLLLPFFVVSLIWLLLHSALVQLALVPRLTSWSQLIQQSFLLGVYSYLTAKLLLIGLLALHLIHSYVYFGEQPLWNYISLTARNLLLPLRPWSLQVGRFDFAPLAGIAVVLGITWVYERVLVQLFERIS